MRPIILSEDNKLKLFEQVLEKFRTEVDNYAFNSNGSTISIKTNFDEVAKDKVKIIYTQEAFLRMQMLVDFFDTEVAWYGLCERLEEKKFRIYDVKICKQYVNGAKVDTEDEDALEFFANLTDDEAEHLHFQAHSHVRMGTGASGVDLQNQQDVIKNMGKSGYYIFQIWNKNNDINTYLYDLDNNVFYDRKDVDIMIEDSLGTMDDFLDSVIDLVSEKKYPYQYGGYKQYAGYTTGKEKKSTQKNKDEKEDEDTPYMQGYYGGDGYYYGERWDYE